MGVKKRWFVPAGALIAIVVVVVFLQATSKPAVMTTGPGGSPASGVAAVAIAPQGDPVKADATSGPAAPEFVGIVQWLNSEPVTLASLRGRVVLLDFWTYSCINCLHTLPHVRDWHEKYATRGLVIVGVHSPEFDFEKSKENVRQAVARERVTWPVAMDNNFETWEAYQNRFWPHKFLIDRNGVVRYDHIGEGAYLETEMALRQLLSEIGADVSQIPVGL